MKRWARRTAADGTPRPPRGRPRAAYAAILDGHTLWLAVDSAHGRLSLREPGGDVVQLRSDLPDDQPGYTSIRADLAGLPVPESGEQTWEVVLARPLLPDQRVWSPGLPESGPTRTPPTPDGRAQLSLDRADDGTLLVRRQPLPPTVELLRVVHDEPHVRFTVAAPASPEDAALVVLDGDDAVLLTLPLVPVADGLEAAVSIADLPPDRVGVVRFAVGTPDAWVRVRRRANDFTDPAYAALLPALFGDDPEVPRVRFRWSPDGLLAARMIDPAEEQP
ncbi:hypothetical protein [Nocardioides sp. SYSU D00038]|uniref:hypothetical protein n=1 Tax=Nocardioides sp. SYSU D00038 TaxID=2812554 RepID=UPI001967B39F|nr:hypothetical protein [Nocardioides sp. SYSU D00038]